MNNIKIIILDILESLVVSFLIFLVVYFFVGQLLEIDGESMMPNFRPGEHIVAEKISMRTKALQRGEVVIVKHPKLKKLLIKRVIGLPGETIEIKENSVYINENKLDEPYLDANEITKGLNFIQEQTKYTIPANYYMVLGDNRDNSTDSRSVGWISEDAIEGKAFMVFYPFNRIRMIK